MMAGPGWGWHIETALHVLRLVRGGVFDTLYPYIVRSTYGALGFPQYPGEAGASDATAAEKEKAQNAAVGAVDETLAAFHKFFLAGKTLIGGDHVSIADIRLAASLEFLKVIDYHFEDLHGRRRQRARRRLRRAGEGCRGLYRLCEGAEEVGVRCGPRRQAVKERIPVHDPKRRRPDETIGRIW